MSTATVPRPATLPLPPAAPDLAAIEAALAAPFEPGEVKWKPQTLSKDGKRALAIAYVDARVIMDRLDEVVGASNWQDRYDFMPDGSVACTLKLRLGGEWIEKMDVGGQSEQPDEGDRKKAAVSDALKRAAVKWGLGRYLYRLPQQWVDYDSAKKRFLATPTLPKWALPKAKKTLPATGKQLLPRLAEKEKEFVAEGLCKAGELLQAVKAAGVAAGFGPNINLWAGPAIELAAAETKAFAARCRKAQEAAPPGVAFLAQLRDKEDELEAVGLCSEGDAQRFVVARSAELKCNFPLDVSTWNEAQVKLGRSWLAAFESQQEAARR